MVFTFPVFQLNCQKRSQSAVVLQELTNSASTFISLIQEPYTYAGGARGLNRKHNVISALTPKPRAIIYCHRNAFVWPVPALCSRDISVAIWDTRTRFGCVLLVSWYWDYTEKCLPAALTAIVQFAEERGYPLWFSADSNAHSPMWGCPDLNARGRQIESFLFAHGLSLLNRGNRPTYRHPRGDQSIIDITFVSHALVDLVQDWWVSDEATSSDHSLVRIQLHSPPPV